MSGQRTKWRTRQERPSTFQSKERTGSPSPQPVGGDYDIGEYDPFSSIPTQPSYLYDESPNKNYPSTSPPRKHGVSPSLHHMFRENSADTSEGDFQTARPVDSLDSNPFRNGDEYQTPAGHLEGVTSHHATYSDEFHSPTARYLDEVQPSKPMESYEDVEGFAPTPNMNSSLVEGLVRELRTLAALEVSVYLARGCKYHSEHAVSLHTPARRLARTIVTFGAEEGIIFGMRAARAIEAAADGCNEDARGMLFWWSNCVQLRWMLWAMCGGAEGDADGGGLGNFAGIKQVLLPPLRDLEVLIFDRMVSLLWNKVAVPAACLEGQGVRPPSPPALPRRNANPVKSTTDMSSQHEAAVERWLIGLSAALDRLEPPGSTISLSKGHLRLVKQRLLSTLLHKLDTILLEVLITDDLAHVGLSLSPESLSHNLVANELPNRVLPFQRGSLTFSTGINLKMAVSRWTNWARDKGLEEGHTLSESMDVFPKLRACADLLMLPKDFLMDKTARREVVPGIGVNHICKILQRFEPDEFSPDAVPPGLLDQLSHEALSEPADDAPFPAYVPATEQQLLADGLIELVSLEMDDGSDEELESITDMYDPDKNGEGSYRFMLLRDLWASAR